MAEFTIYEDRDELIRLIRHHAGTEHQIRLQMLLRFLDKPDCSSRAIAEELGIPESTLRRWRNIYSKEGVQGLLQFRGRGNRRPQQVRSGRADYLSSNENSSVFSSSMHDFLNNFPVATNSMKWSKLMQEHLVRSFNAVDYALVCVSLIDTRSPGKNIPDVSYQQIGMEEPGTGRTKYRGKTVTLKRDRPLWKVLIDNVRQITLEGNRSRSGHQARTGEPAGFDYYLQTDNPATYMGSIILVHDTGQGRFPSSTIRVMEELYPFFRNQFLHHINAVNLSNADRLELQRAVHGIVQKLKLTRREKEVLCLLLNGHSPQEIADSLHIAYQTVTTHIGHIYRKTGVSRLGELFGRYLIRNDTDYTGEGRARIS